MQGEDESARRGVAPLALCLLLSLVVHGGAVGALPYALRWVGRPAAVHSAPREREQPRVVQIVRERVEPTQFVKTDPDQEEQEPEEPDFAGKRSTSESASEFAPNRYDDAPLPTQNGEEDKQEVVTFDQMQQKGELEHDGSSPSGVIPSPTSTSISPTPPAAPPAEPTEAEETEPPAKGTSVVQPPPLAEDVGNILLQNTPVEEQEGRAPVKIEVAVRPEEVSQASAAQQAFYDPALAGHMQAQRGFRTYERRTRSTGRFVIGRKPSLNVAATPRGRYEEEIYRRIAYFWYRACDDHRGDIIPGSLVISLRINTRGQLQNMELVQRQGASVSQQSFTFGAIRRASLPPMPPEVQRDVVGDLLELIFHFNFD